MEEQLWERKLPGNGQSILIWRECDARSNYNNIRRIKDEFHFLLICPVYENLRQKYINKRFQRCRNKQNFIKIVSSDSIEQLTNLDTSMRLTNKAKDPQLTSVPLE